MQTAIRCMLMRGTTSKGAYFLAEDLPRDPAARDRVLLSVMGSQEPRQVDDLGGAHRWRVRWRLSLAQPSLAPTSIFPFVQVGVDKPMVDTTSNCGNMLVGVGPFVIERDLIKAGNTATRVRGAPSP